MKLLYVSSNETYFPRAEWQWLRKPVSLEETTADFFLWGVRTKPSQPLWVWSKSGAEVENLPASITVLELSPIAGEKVDDLELWAYSAYLKTSFEYAAPQDAEWVSALQVLKNRFQYSLAEQGLPAFWEGALRASRLEPHLGVLAQRKKFTFLSLPELQLLFDKSWDLSAFELIATWAQELRDAFLEAISKWSLGVNHVKEVAVFISMLQKKMGLKSALTVLKAEYQSNEQFRFALLNTAQPELASLSKTRLERLRGLKLPPRTTVFGDPSFENDNLRITHTPRTMGDFELFQTWVENPLTKEKIAELLEIYQ